MKKVLSSVTLAAFLLSASASYAEEKGFCKVENQVAYDGQIFHDIDEDQCYDNSPGNSLLIGMLAGGAIAGGVWIGMYMLNRTKASQYLQFRTGEVEFENDSKFYYKPAVNVADNLKVGWKAGLQW